MSVAVLTSVVLTSDDLMSVQNAARQLGHPRITIYRWIDKGKLVSVRFGGTLYIPRSEVERIQRIKK